MNPPSLNLQGKWHAHFHHSPNFLDFVGCCLFIYLCLHLCVCILVTITMAFWHRLWLPWSFCCIDWLLVLIGNAMLLRVLPSVYPRQPEPIHQHIRELTAMMSQLDQAGRQHLLRLLQMISDLHPLVSEEVVDEWVKEWKWYLGRNSGQGELFWITEKRIWRSPREWRGRYTNEYRVSDLAFILKQTAAAQGQTR